MAKKGLTTSVAELKQRIKRGEDIAADGKGRLHNPEKATKAGITPLTYVKRPDRPIGRFF